MATIVQWSDGLSYPRVTSDDILAFERSHNIVLPDEYRDFLLASNGGHPEPDCFTFRNEYGRMSWARVDYFLGIHIEPHEASGLSRNTDLAIRWETYKSTSDPRMPEELMPIASSNGNKVCLAVCGDKVGQVYYWDHENELGVSLAELMDEAPGSLWQNCVLIANSFNEFLDGLRERPDD